MDYSIPIVVIGYDRPDALKRLLSSLSRANFSQEIKLYISIDGGGDPAVTREAEAFEWPHGEKELILHTESLGLRKHVLACGELVKKHEGIILLEDDLFVAPDFYTYVTESYNYYKDDERIGGVSLYSHAYNETAQFPFIPLNDGSDVFFFQYASSWGQFWTREQWMSFRKWYDEKPSDKLAGDGSLPPNILLWPETSWKKYFIRFLIEKEKYFVYPRQSFTTNFNDPGQHIKLREKFFQVPLAYNKTSFHFIPFEESNAVYDVYCEMIPDRLKRLCGKYEGYDLEVDLYGMKVLKNVKAEYLLTTTKMDSPLETYGREMKPHEANVIEGIPGNEIFFGKTINGRDKAYMQKLLKCHEKKHLNYFYPLREYHFSGQNILSTPGNTQKRPGPVFLAKKFLVMFRYAFFYFFRKK